MTVISERAIVVVIRLEGPTQANVDHAFQELRDRIEHTLPARRFAPCTVIERDVQPAVAYSRKFGPAVT